jgi:CarD family transcriptional regulator
VFEVGDWVVYPMHGAGVIQAIEEREVLGERRRYYVLSVRGGNIKVMVPVDGADRCGLRAVLPREEFRRVLDVLRQQGEAPVLATIWNRRFRANVEKLKSGDPYAVAEVVRSLARRERDRGLSSGERKMLESARQILESELALIEGVGEAEAHAELDRLLA